jgi:hypothetical protein
LTEEEFYTWIERLVNNSLQLLHIEARAAHQAKPRKRGRAA